MPPGTKELRSKSGQPHRPDGQSWTAFAHANSKVCRRLVTRFTHPALRSSSFAPVPCSLKRPLCSALRRRMATTLTIQRPIILPPNASTAGSRQSLGNLRVPSNVVEGTYRCSPPLIRPSKLTTRENGGVGKDLSEGWNLNFAVGCTHACPLCYVDAIHKRFGSGRHLQDCASPAPSLGR